MFGVVEKDSEAHCTSNGTRSRINALYMVRCPKKEIVLSSAYAESIDHHG
jgi:hypothetical protein